MTVEITPRGTRGWEPPRPLRPLLGAMTRLQVRLYHRFGDRMRVQGRPVLLLTPLDHSGRQDGQGSADGPLLVSRPG